MSYLSELWPKRWEDLQSEEKDAIAEVARSNFRFFARVSFWIISGHEFLWVDGLHDVICDNLLKIFTGIEQKIVLNIPPRYGKTELACLFNAWAFGINPRCETLHISFSDNLINRNSRKIRAVMEHDFYHRCFDTRLSSKNSKVDEWQTEEGGLFQSRTTFGKVTGLGCGAKNEIDKDGRFMFAGMMWIDDPLKPSDAHTVERQKVNEAYSEVLQSRLNSPMTTPSLCTMQRLHEEDLTFELVTRYAFKQVKIKGLMDGGEPLWPFMHSAADFATMATLEPYTYASQYQQEPTPKGGSIFLRNDWRRYASLPESFDRVIITADTAQKIKEHNDFSVFQLWGKYNGRIYLIDQSRGKWEADLLLSEAVKFISSSKTIYPKLREVIIEDKASGTGLIQQLPAKLSGICIQPKQRNVDKITRAYDAQPYVKAGLVLLPSGSEWVEGFIDEHASFNATMSHAHDDQVDPTMDAIDELLDKVAEKVFNNVKEVTITDKDISAIGTQRRGIVWGVASSPFVYVELLFNKAENKIVIFNEIYESGVSNKESCAKIKEVNSKRGRIIAEATEPNSVAELRRSGLNIVSSHSYPDALEYGIKYLRSLDQISIDPVRCPNAFREFKGYEIDEKMNETANKYSDVNNRSIKAAILALEMDTAKRGMF